jgi:hypothetical protein
VYTHFSVTTASPANVNTREEAVRNDLDACQLFVFTQMRPFLTSNNVYPNSISQAMTQVRSVISALQSTGNSNALGPMLLSATISVLRMSLISPEQLVLQLTGVALPFPYSEDIDLTITLS